MKIKVNLNGGYKTVQEGSRELEITKVEMTPSGRPTKLKLYMKDVEDGATLVNSYNLENETGEWLAGKMLATALNLNDGDDFDLTPTSSKVLVGKHLQCTVEHTEYNGKVYANIRSVDALVSSDEDDGNYEEINSLSSNIYSNLD